MAKHKEFFKELKEQSNVKAEIVSKYFWGWASAIKHTIEKHNSNIAYIDLFSGPGCYEDGAKSTPILVLEKAVNDTFMQERLKTIFNDGNPEFSFNLSHAIKEISGIEKLKYQPIVSTSYIGTEIVKIYQNSKLVPTLFFVDPWGYKGLSLELIASVLKDWGCDCIFFFNYNRINMGLTNEIVREKMNELFGEKRAEELRKRVEGLESSERELEIIEAITQSLKKFGGTYVLPFNFKRDTGVRTSHYLIFVSKSALGYKIMKDIMASYSSQSSQGVPSFCYSPATERQPLLFEFSRPLDGLCQMLLDEFSGQSLTMGEIFERHNIDRPFVEKNYKDALNHLESIGKIIADPPASRRLKRNNKATFANHVVVTIPAR